MPRFRPTIGGLTALAAAVGALGWASTVPDLAPSVLKHWPLVAMIGLSVGGLAWSIGGIYRAPDDRQAIRIAALIVSLLGLVAGPLWYALRFAEFDL